MATCLKVLTTASLLILEAQKLSLHLPIEIWSSHNMQDIISHNAVQSVSPPRVQILHSTLIQPDLTFKRNNSLNLASLLLTETSVQTPHDCPQILDSSLRVFHHITDTITPKLLTDS
jgi:hypothetical protein